MFKTIYYYHKTNDIIFDLKIYIDLFKYNPHIQVVSITTKYVANFLSIFFISYKMRKISCQFSIDTSLFYTKYI